MSAYITSSSLRIFTLLSIGKEKLLGNHKKRNSDVLY